MHLLWKDFIINTTNCKINGTVYIFFLKSHILGPDDRNLPIFVLFWLSQILGTPKVGVHRENLLIGNVAQTVFGGFYICWEYVISFSQHFPMRKFSPSPPTSPSPLSHWNSETWLKFGKIFLKNISKNMIFLGETYIKVYVLRIIFMIFKIFFFIFLIFFL